MRSSYKKLNGELPNYGLRSSFTVIINGGIFIKTATDCYIESFEKCGTFILSTDFGEKENRSVLNSLQ